MGLIVCWPSPFLSLIFWRSRGGFGDFWNATLTRLATQTSYCSRLFQKSERNMQTKEISTFQNTNSDEFLSPAFFEISKIHPPLLFILICSNEGHLRNPDESSKINHSATRLVFNGLNCALTLSLPLSHLLTIRRHWNLNVDGRRM